MSDIRREARKTLGYPATIVLPDVPPIPCVVMDVSNSGARLGCKVDLPDAFVLMLSTLGAQRDCIVMWRRDGEVGVKFQRRASVELMPQVPVEVPAPETPPLAAPAEPETVLI